MEWIYENIVPQPRRYHTLMTSCEKVEEEEFLRIVSTSDEIRRKFANTLTSYPDVLVEIIRDEVGLNRVMRMLGISDDVDTILLYPVMCRFSEIMTHEHGKVLASRVLGVCNIHQRNMLCNITYRHTLVLAHDENGCELLKDVITKADDLLKDDFLQLIAEEAHSICTSDLGISLFQHVLNLEYTKKSTEEYDEDDPRSHELMAEFDGVLSSTESDATLVELHKLALTLTSDPELFMDFVKTERGSLMLHVILGKSEEIDRVFLEAIKQSFTDVSIDTYGFYIMERTVDVLEKRGDSKVRDQILRLTGYNALYLTDVTNFGNILLQDMINLHDMHYTELVACGLQCHYIELSFTTLGSSTVKKLLGEVNTELPLIFIAMEIVKCDEETLVRLAKDEYGNQVLKMTLEVAKESRADLFADLVDKLKPFLDSLRGSLGEKVVASIIES